MTGYYSIEFVYMHELHNKNALNQKRRSERKERKLNSSKMEMYTHIRTHSCMPTHLRKIWNIFCIICGQVQNVFCGPTFTYSFCTISGSGAVWEDPLLNAHILCNKSRPLESWALSIHLYSDPRLEFILISLS